MKIFLDSCVILSRIPREIFLQAAKEGRVELFYSDSVRDESMHVAERNGIADDIMAAFVDLLLYGNQTSNAPERDDLWLPDEDDRHVVLGALGAGADGIATENLKDFPKAALEPLGLQAKSPDQIFYQMIAEGDFVPDIQKINSLKRAKLYRTAKLLKQKLDE